jgi:hypothetical protein
VLPGHGIPEDSSSISKAAAYCDRGNFFLRGTYLDGVIPDPAYPPLFLGPGMTAATFSFGKIKLAKII